MDTKDIRGNFSISTSKGEFLIELSGSAEKMKSSVKFGDQELKSSVAMNGDWANFTFTSQDSTAKGINRISAKVIDNNHLSGANCFC